MTLGGSFAFVDPAISKSCSSSELPAGLSAKRTCRQQRRSNLGRVDAVISVVSKILSPESSQLEEEILVPPYRWAWPSPRIQNVEAQHLFSPNTPFLHFGKEQSPDEINLLIQVHGRLQQTHHCRHCRLFDSSNHNILITQ
jgi:hypothetical protein